MRPTATEETEGFSRLPLLPPVEVGQQVRGEGVARVTVEHGPEQGLSAGSVLQTELGLGVQEQGGGFLPELQVVLEEQHGRQRGGKVLDPGFGLLELLGVSQQLAQELLGAGLLAEAFPGQGGIIGHFTEGADAHFLEVAGEGRRGQPMLAGPGFVAERS